MLKMPWTETTAHSSKSTNTEGGDHHSKKHSHEEKDHNTVHKNSALQDFMDNQGLNLGVGIIFSALMAAVVGYWIYSKVTSGRTPDEGDLGTIFIVMCYLLPFVFFFMTGLHWDSEDLRREWQVAFLFSKTGVIVKSKLKWLPGLAIGFPYSLDKAESTSTEIKKYKTSFKMRDLNREYDICVVHRLEATDSHKVANHKPEDLEDYINNASTTFFSDHFKPFNLAEDLSKNSGRRNWSTYMTNNREHIDDIEAVGYSVMGRIMVTIVPTDSSTDNKAGIFWKRYEELKAKNKQMPDREIVKSAMQLAGLTNGFAFFGEGTDPFIQGKAMDYGKKS